MASRVIVLMMMAVLSLPAQTPTSSIQGTVKDITGAVMVGVSVVVTNVQTGVTHTAVSNQAGEYLASYLLSGEYTVRAEAPGFKRFVRAGITLQMEQKARIDIEMAVGSNTETVEVVAAAPLLQSEQSTLGQVVNLRQVHDLPLQGLGRNPHSLVALIPGVFDQPGAAFSAISGGRAASSAILLDGVGNHDTRPIHIPSVDAVQEFKVHTHAFSAEYGRTGGGVVNLSIKSGTNRFQGSVFEFLRNDALNARNFFSLPQAEKPPLRYNEFGGTLGGPILRNRLFFFASYQGVREHTSGTYVGTVPTALQRGGSFTEGNQARVYDPATTRPDPASPSRVVRDQFAGNRIPASRFDAVAARLMPLFPAPNTPALVSNYVISPTSVRTSDTADGRLDYRLTQNDGLMVRYSHGSRATIPGKVFPGLGDRTKGVSDTQDRNVTLQEVHTFSPQVINELRLGFSRLRELQTTVGYPGNQAQLFGISSFPSLGMPVVNISGTAGLGPDGSRNLLNQAYQYLYLVDSITFVRGRHVVKAGTDNLVDRHRRFQPDVGTFNFDSTFTSLPGTANTGIGLASFLLGQPTSASLNLSQIATNYRAKTLSLFVQDDWKASRGLTLNLGLRYDGIYPMTEGDDQISNFNIQTALLERVGREGRPRSPFDFTARFGPRFGFAWQPHFLPRTVARGGYGVFSSMVERYNQPMTFPWGFWGGVTLTSSDNVTPPFILSEGPPASSLRVLEGITGPGFGASGLTNLQRKPSADYIQNWQFSIQREMVAQRLVLDVAYAGSRGTRLMVNVPLNQVPPGAMGPGNAQARRPYPHLQSVSTTANAGNSIYHSLQAKLEGQFPGGSTFLVSYTYSREINDFQGPAPGVWNSGVSQFVQNAYNLRAERGIGGFNFPQRLVASYVYQLPFGRGRALLSSGGPASAILGGWRLSGITALQTGGPAAISVSPNACNCFNGGLRPNRVGDGRLPGSERTLTRFFDTSAFVAPPQYTFGNSEKNLLLSPGLVNFDFSVSRRLYQGGADQARALEFRCELFNAFNTPQFSPPGTVVGTPQFGRITAARAGRTIQFAVKFRF